MMLLLLAAGLAGWYFLKNKTPATTTATAGTFAAPSGLPGDAVKQFSFTGTVGQPLDIYVSPTQGYFQVNTNTQAVQAMTPAHYQAVLNAVNAGKLVRTG